MPGFYEYSAAIFGTQSTDGNGSAINYSSSPSGTWQYSGGQTSFVIEEANRNNRNFDGDRPTNYVSTTNQIGRGNAQTVNIDGTARQVIWDYTFRVMDPSTGETWDIGVVDVDLNNNNYVSDASEPGYYLIFIDGAPPAGVTLDVVGVVEDADSKPHSELGGTIVCFAAGSLIETEDGPRKIEKLIPGDRVMTRDAGYQPLRWIGRTRVPARGRLAPVVIEAGAMGNSCDLLLSPQHAVLLTDWRAQLLYGADDVLVRAIDLVGQDGIHQREGGFVTYCHILFDAHHLVQAAGIWSESLYPGDMTCQSVNSAARAEIESLFPDLATFGPKSALCLRRYEARCLAA